MLVRNRLKLTDVTQNRLLLTVSYGNPFVQGTLFVLLSICIGINIDFATDFHGSQLPGTLLIVGICIMSLIKIVLSKQIECDKQNKIISIRYVLGLPCCALFLKPQSIFQTRYQFTHCRSVTIQHIVLLKKELLKEHVFNGVFSFLSSIVQLSISTHEKTIVLSQGQHQDEFDEIGRCIASFISIPYCRE